MKINELFSRISLKNTKLRSYSNMSMHKKEGEIAIIPCIERITKIIIIKKNYKF